MATSSISKEIYEEKEEGKCLTMLQSLTFVITCQL